MQRAYTKEALDIAVSAVKEGGFTVHAASLQYGIPYGTLYRRVNGHVASETFTRGPKPALGDELELEMKTAIVELQRIGYGLTRKEILEMAVKINEKSVEPVFKSGKPSNRWYQRFMSRNGLTLRTAENLSVARLQMSTVSVRNELFDTLTEKYAELHVAASDVYNMDESGLQLVAKGRKIAAVKGSKTVYKTKSGERSENITVVACANASGTVCLPPMVIFKGETMSQSLVEDAPEGTIFASSKRGYMVTELFYEWFTRFLRLIPPKRPVILLLDGHGTHITREVIVLARENEIHLVCFPPHTTHLYQPMDVGLFTALKDIFKEESDKRLRRTKKIRLNRYDFFKVFKPSWMAAASQSNIIGGFVGSGMWPLDREKISAERLIGSVIPEANTEPNTPSCPSTSSGKNSPVVETLLELFSPLDVNVAANGGVKKSRAVTKTRCLPSNKFLAELDLKQKEKADKEASKSRKRRKPSLTQSDSEDEPTIPTDDDDRSVAEEDLATPCGKCRKIFDEDCNGENWFSCCKCRVWYHLTCQGLSNNSKLKQIVCKTCKK